MYKSLKILKMEKFFHGSAIFKKNIKYLQLPKNV